jgi:hypothetical protein
MKCHQYVTALAGLYALEELPTDAGCDDAFAHRALSGRVLIRVYSGLEPGDKMRALERRLLGQT